MFETVMHINSNRFNYDKQEQHFSGFASDARLRLGRLYPDACDVGFIMVSERTGKELTFYLDEEETRKGLLANKEGEITAWHFKPVTNDPALKNLTVTLWND